MNENSGMFNTLIGLATLGSAVTGVAGFFAAIVAFAAGEYIAVGVCLAAAALAFGLLTNVVLGE